MDRQADELDGIEAVRVLVEPGRSGGRILPLPDAAVIREPDGRRNGKGIHEEAVRVCVKAGIVTGEGRAAVRGAFQDVGACAARIAADVDDVCVVRIDSDRIVVRALTAAIPFRGGERSAPGHAAVNGFANLASLTNARACGDGGRLVRGNVDRDYRADLIDREMHDQSVESREQDLRERRRGGKCVRGAHDDATRRRT
jgi:hypothetical protein